MRIINLITEEDEKNALGVMVHLKETSLQLEAENVKNFQDCEIGCEPRLMKTKWAPEKTG